MEKHRTATPLALPSADDAPQASYWEKAAMRYRRASHILGGTLALFCVVFLLFFTAAFRFDSFYYFFMDVRALAGSLPQEESAVSFAAADGESTALLFRGNVANVNTACVEIDAANGKNLLLSEHTFAAPRAVASRKILLAYDFDETSFSVYNAYAELYRGETETPIYLAAAGDTGAFLLVTKYDAGGSQILLYNKDFQLSQRFLRRGATTGAALSPNGKLVALFGSVSEQDGAAALLDLYQPGKTEPMRSFRFENEFPLAVAFLGNKTVAALTDTGLRILTAEGKTVRETLFDGNTPYAFTCGKKCCAVSLGFRDAPQCTVLVVGKNGKTVSENELSAPATALSLCGKDVFCLTGDRLWHCPAKGENTALTVPMGAIGIAATDARTVRIFYGGAATCAVFAR